MATRTVLSMVQNILSSMDSDEVNSISDTIESAQVAGVIKETYEDMVEEYELPSRKALFQLNPSGTDAKPTHMTLPDLVISLDWIRYNSVKAVSDPVNYVEIKYLDPEDFLDLINARNSSDPNVQTVPDDSGVQFLIVNNKNPTYWTSFDAKTIIFDSYDSALGSTLVSSETNCFGALENTITIADGTIPDLPSALFPLLLSESKSRCFAYFKQTINAKVEQRARRQKVMQQKRKHRVSNDQKTINYGRK